MKKFLTFLTLCLISIMSFGQYEYTKVQDINDISNNDTVILYCEALNATLDSFVIDSFETAHNTYNKQCYGVNTNNTLDSAMCFIVYINKIFYKNKIVCHISLYTLNHDFIYCGQYTSSTGTRWWGIGAYIDRNEFEEAKPWINLDNSFISGLYAGYKVGENDICFCTSDFWGGSIGGTKPVSVYKNHSNLFLLV